MPRSEGSPWPEEHPRDRPVTVLADDLDADVAIVGGGISGMATAYCLLSTTDLSVAVLETGLIGSGATGNNGGQAVEASEAGFKEIAARAGRERALRGFREMGTAWETLQHLLRTIGAPSMLVEVTGRLGLADQEAIERWSKDLDARREAGLDVGRVHVAEDAPVGMFKGAPRTPRAMLARQMWSRDRRYQVTAEVKVGLINTYDLVETLAAYLLASYPGRASIFERSPVDLIRLSEEDATLRSNGHVITADSVVMCTNGYRMPRIESCSPPLIGGKIEGRVGYMAGSEAGSGPEGARAYFPGGDDYYYVARRRYRDGWLTAAGGPERPITGDYDPGTMHHPGAYEQLEAFLSTTLDGYSGPFPRRWKGVMGYTPTGARVVGQDPRVPSMYYNLGCNGIGILSAVAGSVRLASVIGDEDLEPSMFDPELLSPEEDPRITGCGRVRVHHP